MWLVKRKEPNSVAMFVWNDFCNDARVLKEAESLQGNSFRVTVYAFRFRHQDLPEIEVLPSGVSVVRVYSIDLYGKGNTKGAVSKKNHFGKSFLNVRRIFTRSISHISVLLRVITQRPSVIHSHDVNTLPTMWLAAKIARAKLVYDTHEISVSREGYEGLKPFVRFIESFIIPRVDLCIATTVMRAKFLARYYKVKRPLAVYNKPAYFSKVSSKENRLRSSLTLDSDQTIVLYQGGLQAGRGLDRLVRVAKRIENAHFVFIGAGNLKQELEDLVAGYGITERVHFIGKVPLSELMSYTCSANIGIQPLENTCFNHFSTDSNKLFEYLLAELPVLAPNFPEIRRVIEECNAGMLFDQSDESLFSCLSSLVNDEKYMQLLASNARNSKHLFHWGSEEPKLLTAYNRLVNC